MKMTLRKDSVAVAVFAAATVVLASGCRCPCEKSSSTAVYRSDVSTAGGAASENGAPKPVAGAMGSAESTAGESVGQAAGDTITDATSLIDGATFDLSGRPVDLSKLKVRSVFGDDVVSVDAGNGQSLYLYCAQGGDSLNAGDWVNVRGMVRTSASELSGSALRVLSSQSVYVDAHAIERAH